MRSSSSNPKLVLAGALLALSGCSLIAAPDESLLTSSSSSSASGGAGGGAVSGSTVASSSATSSGSGGQGGQGGGGSCGSPADCPTPPNECVVATCAQNACGTENKTAGTATATQTPADCKKAVCDGAGAITTEPDNTDLPDDSNLCTTDGCNAGTPIFTPVTEGTSCGTSLQCDATGHCVGCLVAGDCGTDTDCRHFNCDAQHVCGHTDVADGTATSSQTTGDCKKNQCSNGLVTSVNDANDPLVDGKQCTLDLCTNGTASNPPLMTGTSCTQNGGKKCDAAGDCVACLSAADCGTDTDCKKFSCSASGQCSTTFVAAGTATSMQATGDCKENQCDGSGAVIVAALASDVPNDQNPCTDDVCTGSTPSNPSVGAGTSCPLGAGTGLCDGAGTCVECNQNTDCGTSTECVTYACSGAHTCMTGFTAAGFAVASQTGGDCHTNRCDGMGAVANVVDDADLPIDNAECTSDVCTAGVPSNPALAFDVACPVTAGHFCNGTGTCVECNTGSECPSLVCSASGVCQQATCTDAVKNQDESDTDCGGAVCPHCPNGGACAKSTDCLSGFCGTGFCASPPVPTVTTTSPADSQAAVDPLSPIVLTFSASMDPATLTTKSTLDAGPCTGAVQISTDGFTTCLPLGAPVMSANDTVATFTPTPALSFGSAYRVRVTTSAKSAFGVALGSQYDQPNGFLTATDATVLNESGAAGEADYCVVQFPKSFSVQTGATTTSVYCQVYEAGVTDPPGPAGTFTVDVGYGPPSANPEDQAGWTWFPTTFNVQSGNNDEYVTTFTAPATGDYRYACRVTMNAGGVTYCDADGAGSNPGLAFEPTALPVMTVTP